MSSYGQTICREYLTILTESPFVENHRPDWLMGLEVDFFFPKEMVAIEFNGDQHYFDTKTFGQANPQRARDCRKRQLCKDRGVFLITLKAIDLVMCKLVLRLKKRLPIKGKRSAAAIDAKAKRYRDSLKDSFHSPTAHRAKGTARQKTVEKFFTENPPDFSGKWNADKFNFQWRAWVKDKPKVVETVLRFSEVYGTHLRARQERKLTQIATKWGAKKIPPTTESVVAAAKIHAELDAEFASMFGHAP